MFDEWLRVAIFLVAMAVIMVVVCAEEGLAILMIWIIIGWTAWTAFHIQRGFNQADINRQCRRHRR